MLFTAPIAAVRSREARTMSTPPGPRKVPQPAVACSRWPGRPLDVWGKPSWTAWT